VIGVVRLTHQSGEARRASPHVVTSRVYVPWAFGNAQPGYESGVEIPDGIRIISISEIPDPTTVERHETRWFVLKEDLLCGGGPVRARFSRRLKRSRRCEAVLARLRSGRTSTSDDYTRLLPQYAVSARKDGRTLIAEAPQNPFTRSWQGHDNDEPQRNTTSHSGFVDARHTGWLDWRPGDGNSLVVRSGWRPRNWAYLRSMTCPYQGHRVAIRVGQMGSLTGSNGAQGLHVFC